MKNKDELIKKITELNIQIKKFEQRMQYSNICRDLYDGAVLQRAVLKKELEEYDKNPVLGKLKKLFPHKKTLICDYFKS